MIKISFVGWGDEYDQWLPWNSSEIYPIGWCKVVRKFCSFFGRIFLFLLSEIQILDHMISTNNKRFESIPN